MSPPSPDKLDSQRHLFEIPAQVTYLNCANMAPQMRRVKEAGLAALKANASPWTRTGEDWFAGAETLRALAGRLINAEADCMALVPAASYGIALAAANVPVERGQSIVILDRQFPSNVYAWRVLAQRRGGRVHTVQRAHEDSWTASLLQAIDADTAVVAIPNCHWTDGSLVDLKKVGEKARSVGAALVIDASQSLGAYPLDVAQIQPDFLVSVGYKWLLGPLGVSYLYVAPRWHAAGVPLEYSWLSRAGAEDFASLVDYTDEFRAGARRFDMGEFSQFTLLPMATAALQQLLEWGVGRIHQTACALNQIAADAASEIGAWALPAQHRAGHILGLHTRGERGASIAAALRAADIHVSVRGDLLRIAPHVYNDRSDIERLITALRGLLR